MKYVGVYVSVLGGLVNVVICVVEIEVIVFVFFIKNQCQWCVVLFSDEIIVEFKVVCEKYYFGLGQILLYDSYLINFGYLVEEVLEKFCDVFIDEMICCQQLGLMLFNFYFGSYLQQILEEECLVCIVELINIVLVKIEGVIVVIENIVGQGSNFGFKFEYFVVIIDGVEDKFCVGVCIDICYVFVVGYDLCSVEVCEKIFVVFECIVGFQYLCGMYFNDVKSVFGSWVDCYYSLGEGNIGYDCFSWIMQDSCFDGILLILEIINLDIWVEEIVWLWVQQIVEVV